MLITCKKSFLLTSLFLLLIAANISQGALINWDNNGGAGNQHWGVATNWAGDQIPYVNMDSSIRDDAQIVLTDSNGVIYDATDDDNGSPRYVYFIVVGKGAGVSGEMWMNGGSLYAPWGLTFNKQGDETSNSKLHMSGGLLHLGPWPGYVGLSLGDLTVGRSGTADCNMTGGKIECVSLQIPQTYYTEGNGTFWLNGGVVIANSSTTEPLDIGATGILNITKGRLILRGNKKNRVDGYVNSGKIVAYPGSTGHRIVNVDYDNISDANTTVTASLTALTQAWKPQPVDTHSKVHASAVLAWNAGDGAISHDVYLGTSFDDVNDGVVTPVTRDVNNYNPGGLTFEQTYYWRVDENDGSNTYKGVVWSFTVTSSPFATSPNPADGTTGVNQNADLSWLPGVGATTHDIYFGTSFNDVNDATNYNEPPGRGRQTATSYDPGTLVLGQKYYWRIDEFDGISTYKGPVWSFTVWLLTASNPIPSDGVKFVDPNTNLAWRPGGKAQTHDVYIGTDFNDVNDANRAVHPGLLYYSENQEPNAYDPAGPFEPSQTYYWRIDEVNSPNIWKGDVWSFTERRAPETVRRILSWNIMGLGRTYRTQAQYDAIAQRILTFDASVITIQEVYDGSVFEYIWSQLGTSWQIYYFGTDAANALLYDTNKVEMLSVEILNNLDNPPYTSYPWDIGTRCTPVSGVFRPVRMYAEPFRVIGVHCNGDADERTAQGIWLRTKIIEFMEDPNEPNDIFLLGDLNGAPDSEPPHPQLQEGNYLHLLPKENGDSTSPRINGYRIDHCYVTQDAKDKLLKKSAFVIRSEYYGETPDQFRLTYSDHYPIFTDFVPDANTDFADLAMFAEQWLATDCNMQNSWCDRADLNGSGTVDFKDFAIFAENWLEGI